MDTHVVQWHRAHFCRELTLQAKYSSADTEEEPRRAWQILTTLMQKIPESKILTRRINASLELHPRYWETKEATCRVCVSLRRCMRVGNLLAIASTRSGVPELLLLREPC